MTIRSNVGLIVLIIKLMLNLKDAHWDTCSVRTCVPNEKEGLRKGGGENKIK